MSVVTVDDALKMKVLVKTLKGTHFEIEVKLQDTVDDVKKNIETVQGSDVYPSAQQMLIHQGKVLKDGTTMEENEVSENSFMVIMLSKNKNSSAPPPTPAAAPPPQPPSSAIIHRILAIGGGAWDRDAVVRALAAAFNNPQRAVQYLNSTIHAGAPPQATRTPPPAPPTGSPNANPLSLLPHGLPAGVGGNLDFLRHSPQFHAFRSRVQANPQILQPILEELWRQNPQLAGLLHEHRSDFLRMIFEPVVHREVSEPESFTITRENMDALNRLEAMGFSGSLVWSVFYACDKNEELAANYLLDHMHEFEE